MNFADILNQVAYAGERITLHRRGKNVAAIVTMADLQLLQDLGNGYNYVTLSVGNL